MATGTGSPAGEGSYILGRSQTQSDFSETSSVGDTRQLVEEKSKENDESRSNIPMTSFNFINSIIGSGIIGMPYALKQAGFGLGLVLLVLVGAVTDYSILLLVEGGRLSNTDTYQEMVLVACGRPGFYLLTVLQFLYPFIAMISYNVIIGDTITKIILRIGGEEYLGRTILGNRQFIIFLITLLVTLPLSLYRNIVKLSKWSFLSLTLVFFIVVCICVRLGTFSDQIPHTPNAWVLANFNFAQAVGIMAFAYMCHHNTFLIHSSLENPTHQRWSLVTHLSIVFSMVLMILLGVAGYTTFTGNTQGDLMENYCHEDDLMNAARFAFAVTIMFTYPVECFVTREVIENAFFANSQPSPLWRHMVVTMVIAACTMAVSMSTDCLGIVLEFNGVLVACPLAYIIPCVCIMKLRQDPILSKSNILPILVLSFGVLVAIIGTVMVFFNIEEGLKGCSHGVEMGYCHHKSAANTSTLKPPVLNFTQ